MTKADEILLGKLQVNIADAMKVHGEDDVVFVDGSWWLPTPDKRRLARQDFETGSNDCIRIEGAHFFDIDDVATLPSPYPHMMPPPKLFAKAMQEMNISNHHHVIVYGQDKCPFVHRAWYQLYAMGHSIERLHVLAGSASAWKEAGGPVVEKVTENPVKVFRAAELPDNESTTYQSVPDKARQVVDIDHIRNVVKDYMAKADTADRTMIVDARSAERFLAQVDEPRPGLRRGHMPGAKNLFFLNLLDPNDVTRLKPLPEVKSILQSQLGIDTTADKLLDQIITTCGSGATAATVAFALLECGVDPECVFLYDGSWMEYGLDDPKNPIETN